MKEIIKVCKSGREVTVEYGYSDVVELTMAFVSLLESLKTNRDTRLAIMTAMEIVQEGAEDIVEHVATIDMSGMIN